MIPDFRKNLKGKTFMIETYFVGVIRLINRKNSEDLKFKIKQRTSFVAFYSFFI